MGQRCLYAFKHLLTFEIFANALSVIVLLDDDFK